MKGERQRREQRRRAREGGREGEGRISDRGGCIG